MIYFYILGGLALVLNILGRVLIVRRDAEMPAGWQKAVKLCPGGEMLYLLFRWEKARLGGVICGVSLALAIPAAHFFLTHYAEGKFANLIAPAAVTAAQPAGSEGSKDSAKLRAFTLMKEKKVAELNRHLEQWFRSLTERQGYLCDEMPEEMAEYNRAALAYQELMRVFKAETEAFEGLRARL